MHGGEFRETYLSQRMREIPPSECLLIQNFKCSPSVACVCVCGACSCVRECSVFAGVCAQCSAT